jgi:uncharacterized membrane-anchored protein YjiN (DUF445 family)
MLNINEEDLKKAIVAQAADTILNQDDDLSGLIAKEVKIRLNKIFTDRAEAQIEAAIDDAVKMSFDREYQRITAWGEASGPATTIRAELEKTTNGYWSLRVNPKTGAHTTSTDSVTRAEYVMTQICAVDFSERMRQSAQNITGALKDGLRNQMAYQMDQLLEGLFRIKSLQDQGKVEKPY